jgi:Cu(I)/Ag(I) efflux system membrane protein CusA/SilA
MKALLRFCLEQKLVVLLLLSFFIGWGVRVAPFDWEISWMKRDPVAVDAIPDLGENQQIIFTEWPGRSPLDVEDQVAYPLTVSLLGVPGVKEVRTYSFFGFSSIYLIFEEGIEFYWSRSRILEKLNSLPADLLPDGVVPRLGPDATALGQVFWYTLEGRDPDGNPAGGWDLDELRAVQDFEVRYALMTARGVSEVASVGGFVREYQVDVDPDRLRAHNVTLHHVANAVRKSNRESGARNIEINGVEYLIRGLGFIEDPEDIRQAVVMVRNNTPITVGDVAEVELGPAMRRGALDKNGAEAVGAVVITRFGENPLETIKETKKKIEQVSAGLPERAVIDWTKVTQEEVEEFAEAQKIDPVFAKASPDTTLNQEAWLPWAKSTDRAQWPEWLTTSKITVVPFYDRSGLIAETLGTLEDALFQQVLITIIVVIIMVLHLRTSVLISIMLPLAVLVTFIAMKLSGVDANVVALAGIAIAIGTVVDVGIVLTENVLKHLDEAKPGERTLPVILRGTHEVAGAVLTAVLTTVISFLPVFALTGEAGRLFRPLAFTKTYALIASLIVALTIIPPLAHLFFGRRARGSRTSLRKMVLLPMNLVAAGLVGWFLAGDWSPLGLDRGQIANFFFVGLILAAVLVFLRLFQLAYGPMLRWFLGHKTLFLTFPVALLLLALCIWLGFGKVFAFVPKVLGNGFKATALWQDFDKSFPGLSSEFRPRLDEGSFLFMPTTSPHASIGEAMDSLRHLDAAISSIPEVSLVVGKIGRVESSLDPAPIFMIESVIHYHPEYRSDENGRPIRFRYDRKKGDYVYDRHGELIPDKRGRPYREWRSHIRTPRDIWSEIEKVAKITGTTGAPLLQPIETRLVMLQTGMRAPMGLKVRAPTLETLELATLELEKRLKEGDIPGLSVATINADRIIGKPYLEIDPDRAAAQRYGLNVDDLISTIQTAIGGMTVTTTVEGRERFSVRVRYQRERRDTIEAMERVLVTATDGTQVPLSQVATIKYVHGPQVIKSENTFLTSYITFGNEEGYTDVDVVEVADAYLEELRQSGALHLPAGVTWQFAGSYKQKLELDQTLRVVLPIALFAIFILLYLQFRSTLTTLIIFSGIAVAWSGGFLLLWLYGRPGFLDFELFGMNVGSLFNVHPIALSAAVWVGFLALFGIATDNGVVITAYLRQLFEQRNPTTREEIREAVIAAGLRRVRPCLMTTATTILALLPVMTSTGKGSDIMGPMAVPIFGGMAVQLLTIFVVPVFYSAYKEIALRFSSQTQPPPLPEHEEHESE